MWIKEIVESLVEKYDTNDPFKIATAKNIYVFEQDLHEEILGFYKYIRRNKFIYINSNLGEEQKIFTIAHELGHSEIHHRLNTPFLKRKTLFSTDKIETEANIFAVELLLPDRVIYEHKDENLTLNEIANIYSVPSEVAHLKNLRNVR
ncbi:ImmA/IrrE family metallo-endopeptidase [Sporosarcina sp. ANT_H38]|uniref:ImmA/IrrE family metallo-endopeptidase n=1 Tax=Sporosarcina sp. ANT_H38 TaxID=2597358 RepID=UPI0011F3C5E6|nr:ImmA/IrrE family metallo-endopeptidase [Sporosarcina sp. ANT_H38]KAA0944119.1 ImmA/IrrE family metallo-endopeptidase [Sporosarcina sp. ANT_H38]